MARGGREQLEEETATQVAPVGPGPSERARGFRLLVVDGPDRGQVVDVAADAVLIGKAKTCHLVLSDPAVSREHLSVRGVDGGLELEDLGSTNGTRFEGSRFERMVLTGDGIVTLGNTTIKAVRERRSRSRIAVRTGTALTDDDLVDLVAHGLSIEDARHQLAFLSTPPPPVLLLRAVRPGDGLVRIAPERHEALLRAWAEGAAAGRLAKFIPASGGATRMFEALLRLWTEGDLTPAELASRVAAGETWAGDALRFHASRTRFPFWSELEAVLVERGLDGETATPYAVAAALLDRRGLDYATRPKGLVRFHASEGGTAIAAHIEEAVETIHDRDGRCRVHVTVPSEHRGDFERVLAACADAARARGIALDATVSTQSPETDSIAVTSDGRPFRTEEGALLYRPSGHGALLANLEESGLEVVHIKNVDNVMPKGTPARELELRTTRLLFGLALTLEAEVRRLTDGLEDDAPRAVVDEAIAFLAREFGVQAPVEAQPLEEQREWALDRLNRPLRVCGMVPNLGQPGGGPFWTLNSAGEPSLQIVEAAQVARSPEQQALLATSTYFNPVDLVCVLRDADGLPHELDRWIDPSTSFVVERSFGGRPLRSVERPGLWNGGMARWNTVFVEIPSACFSPVKTVLDLLRLTGVDSR